MTRFSKHLGLGKEVVIGEDTYLIKPLSTDEAPLFFRLMKMSGDKGFDMVNITDEASEAIRDMINMSLQKSFPVEWKEDEAEMKSFGLKYMMDLLPAIMNANLPDSDSEKDDKRAVLRAKLTEPKAV